MVFFGEKQQKISLALAEALQALGANAEYIRISGEGPNAVDFHIAYWIGRLAEREPNAYFHIVSKDKGFDPMLRHLKANKILAQRVSQLSEIHILNGISKGAISDRVATVAKSLKRLGNSRPRRKKTLKNTIASIFMKTLNDEEVEKIVGALEQEKTIAIKNEVVTYNLSDEDEASGGNTGQTGVSQS